MVSSDNSTTACRNLKFSASRNERILIGRHADSASSCSCDCRSAALEPTILGFNTDTGFIAAPTLFEGTPNAPLPDEWSPGGTPPNVVSSPLADGHLS